MPGTYLMERFRKRDLLLILSLLGAAGLLFLLLHLTSGASGPAAYVLVRIDGKEAGRFPLNQDREISFDTSYGHNLLVIKDGEAYMAEADCPDGYCMAQSPLRKGGERIVCLPHRLIAEAGTYGKSHEAEYDAVAGQPAEQDQVVPNN